MPGGKLVFVKRDLHACNVGHLACLREHGRGRMAVARAVRPKQHDAKAVAPVAIGKIPHAGRIKADHRLDPTGAVKVRPLVAHAQMRFDDAPPDGLDVENAGIAGKVFSDPGAAIILDGRVGRGVHRPVVERAFPARHTRGMAPPARLTRHNHRVRADVAALEMGHPHMPGREILRIVARRAQQPACGPHAAKIDNRFGKHGKSRRRHAVRCGLQPLTVRNRDLIVDPTMLGVPKPGIAVLGGDVHLGRAIDILEILQAPWIGFTDRHCDHPPSRCRSGETARSVGGKSPNRQALPRPLRRVAAHRARPVRACAKNAAQVRAG